MRLALMIEGQEGVSWEDWLALARACEEHGVEALFRSDHYLSQTEGEQPALDAWAVIAALAAQTTRLELGTLVLACHLPRRRRPRERLGDGERDRGRPCLARDGDGLDGGGSTRRSASRSRDEDTAPVARRAAGGRAPVLDATGLHPHLIVGGSGLSGTIRPAANWADEYNTIFATPEGGAERREKLVRACEREGRAPIPLLADDRLRDRTDAGRGARAIRRRIERAGQQLDPDEYRCSEARPRCSAHSTRRRAATCLPSGRGWSG